MNSVKITCQQYLILQAMFNCRADDYSRISLTQVYYDFERDQFVCTDGHVLRLEKLNWEIDTDHPEKFNKPKFSFLLDKLDFQLTKKQLKDKYGKNFESVIIDLSYKPLDGETYPNYMNVIPDLDGSFYPLEGIGISMSLMAKFYSGFYVKPFADRFFFKFTGHVRKAILVFSKDPDDENKKVFRGVIMPVNFSETFIGESVWEISLKKEAGIGPDTDLTGKD